MVMKVAKMRGILMQALKDDWAFTRRNWMGTNTPLGKNVPGQRYKHLYIKSFRKHETKRKTWQNI